MQERRRTTPKGERCSKVAVRATERGNRCEGMRHWWGSWAPINRRAAAPHLSTRAEINTGAIFEQGTDEVQSAFKFAMVNHNQNITTRKFELQAFVDVINTADAYKLSRLICNQFSRGVFSMLGAVSPDSFDTLHSYSNTFQMPFVTPWFPEKVLTPSSGLLDFAISMRPDYHRAIIDTVRYYGWKKIIYLYDSHDGKSLTPRLSHAFLILQGDSRGLQPRSARTSTPSRDISLFIISAK
ncbi:glutamate receptor 1-like [Formica exsecta]|uniref:glutamate receptor 1-like n=1 Tax=Formica exsecta TaxID=72781 RepID=UPI001142EEA4|nr:glutamate receptor 1-like [Formica exsecta]